MRIHEHLAFQLCDAFLAQHCNLSACAKAVTIHHLDGASYCTTA